ncbi:MAG: TonB-dependent receptor, partial [Planctomycetes bacterium]|nr:TonB-dependent receptor [Planctomycetota bacterium]
WLSGESRPEQLLDTGGANLYKRHRESDSKQAGGEFGLFYKRHSLLLGGEYILEENPGGPVFQIPRDDSVEQNWILQNTSDSLKIKNGAAYLQAMGYPLDVFDIRLGIIFGLRYDYNTEWGDTYNLRAGTVYGILNNLHLKLLYGSSFVPPAPTQLNAVPIGNDTVKGNSDLESQNAKTFEIAVDYTY